MNGTPKYKALRGMPDILPEEAAMIRWLQDKAEGIFRLFGYSEIKTSLLEDTEVFTRSIGEHTDIIEKEMYTFEDRGGKRMSLRPEGTASVIRAYVEHGWYNDQDLIKLYYSGPMFRGERPQKGRQRQFRQIGAEIIGLSDPYIDAELIFSLNMFFKRIGLDDCTILINSIGCDKDRISYKKKLSGYLKNRSPDLCEDCRRRTTSNVLRVLDCKRKGCKTVVSEAPNILEYLCEKCCKDYDVLKSVLTGLGVPFKEEKALVRGLDYYTGTIFEAIHPALGAQDAIAAGGRYDNLVREFGGPDRGATGYAVGIERLLLAVDKNMVPVPSPGVIVVPVDSKWQKEAFDITARLWVKGVPCEIDYSGRSLKSQMRKAHKCGRRFVILVGEEEIKNGTLLLKDMETGEQKALEFEKAADYLSKA